MRIEKTRYTERFGTVKINEVQKVLELDSGKRVELPRKEKIAVDKIEEDEIKRIEERMAIIIPIKNEKLKVFEGVLSGMPHDCLPIVISNSCREPTDRFSIEQDTLEQFCHFTQRQAAIVHQKDPGLAHALERAGYTEILEDGSSVRDGKSEGMVLGIILSLLLGKEYVGFVDADNYIPGAVLEYVKNFACGFIQANCPYTMVRNLWRYKPKVEGEELLFKKWGRISEVSNKYINALISGKSGFDTEVIRTANSGEHAMSLELAKILSYASGFASELQELVCILEMFGGVLPEQEPGLLQKGAEVLQIETRNPHIHEEKGDEHLGEMLASSLSVIYHSPLAEPKLREQICEELRSQQLLAPDEEPPKVEIIPPLQKVDLDHMGEYVEEYLPHQFILLEQ
jgi:mannosyl-3-phosphoglycerate synthase